MIEELKGFIATIPDKRQPWKVEHLVADIVLTVLFAILANANNWIEIAEWAYYNESLLKRYLALPHGTASHDTIERVMGSIKPEKFQELLQVWRSLLGRDEGKKLKEILALDGLAYMPQQYGGTGTRIKTPCMSYRRGRGSTGCVSGRSRATAKGKRYR